MEDRPRVHFFIDENLPVRLLRTILAERNHQVTPVQVAFKDPAILRTADEIGAVIITSDKWFLRELFRLPTGHRSRFRQAGVVPVPGTWEIARRRIIEYLPMIEVMYRTRRAQADARLGIDLSSRMIHIQESLSAIAGASPPTRSPTNDADKEEAR